MTCEKQRDFSSHPILTCNSVSSSISALARQPLSGVRTSWHMRLMNSDLASLDAFSRATTSARCAACACAAANWFCASSRALASCTSISAAANASRWLANICLHVWDDNLFEAPSQTQVKANTTADSLQLGAR